MNGLARALLTMPLYFALIYARELARAVRSDLPPYHWGKTEHGREKCAPREAVAGGVRLAAGQ